MHDVSKTAVCFKDIQSQEISSFKFQDFHNLYKLCYCPTNSILFRCNETALHHLPVAIIVSTWECRCAVPFLNHRPVCRTVILQHSNYTLLLTADSWCSFPHQPSASFLLHVKKLSLLTSVRRKTWRQHDSKHINLLLHHYIPTHTLRSTNQFFLDVPRFSTESGNDRLVTWLLKSGINYLLIWLSPTFDTFKRRLKTHLFKYPINNLTMLPT